MNIGISVFFERLNRLRHLSLAVFNYWRYGRPSKKLIVIGVTGTKGKSTTCRLITSALEAGGNTVGLMSTVEFQIGKKRWANDKKMTMLGLGQIHRMLAEMVGAGCRYAVVETSSEGILQYRHYGLNYDIAVFTNLGAEHAERHGGFAKLKQDKGRMFAVLNRPWRKKIAGQIVPTVIVANTDDDNAVYYLDFAADTKIAFGLKPVVADLKNKITTVFTGKIETNNENGTNFVVGNDAFHLQLIGSFNVPNALAAIAVATSQSIGPKKIAAGLNSVAVVPGRMEFIDQGQDFRIVVDYAHEPLSLQALFIALRGLVGRHKIIAIVGSDGGGRDKGKRFRMGEISGELADTVIVTDVNCFDEDPLQIAGMLANGAKKAGKINGENLFIEVDRRQAIKMAIDRAVAGDIIAITAKGTEPCMVIKNGMKIPWDDRAVAKELIAQKIRL